MNQLLNEIFTKLRNGISEKNHPFKYSNLASVNAGIPEQRTVVLRKLTNNKISIYTDARSPKVVQFKNNPNASLRLYDPKTMEQILLKGVINIEKENIQEFWKQVPEHAHKDYSSKMPPGTPINSNKVEYTNNENHFCVLQFEFSKIDYLTIGKEKNTRILFTLKNNTWKGQFVTP